MDESEEPMTNDDHQSSKTIYGDAVAGDKIFGDKIAGNKIVHNYPVAPAPETERERRNRSVMLQKVHDFWVKGVLENSLHKAALIDLGMAYQPDAVAYPWEMVVERPDATPQPLPQGTPIASVFDELRGELLILGSPGSGKTTMLLELARTLIERAQQEETHPIPVVFNLSSWAEKRPPLADWLVEELNARYDVPRKVGQAWIDHDQVLPLLDGLDEVRQDARDACVEAINAYRQEHGMVGMVVCSRVADYAALTAKLKLRGAIMVQPLTDEQIDSYLAQAGDQLVAVQTLLHEDAEMRELAETPLMLSIMSLAYQGMPSDALPEHVSLDARRKHLFETYVERMLKRRGGSKHYTPEQTRHWLSWLAGRMAEHGQTVFYLEQMQPDWLKRWPLRSLYSLILLSSTVIGCLALGGFLGLLLSLLRLIGQATVMVVLQQIHPVYYHEFITDVGLVSESFVTYNSFGLIIGLIVGGLYGSGAIIQKTQIWPTGALNWSWQAIRRRWPLMIVATLAFVITFGFLLLLITGAIGSFFVFLIVGVLIVFLSGLTSAEITTRTYPNEGIWRSAALALMGAVIIGTIITLSIGLVVGVLSWQHGGTGFGPDDFADSALVDGIIVGLNSGPLFGLVFGVPTSALVGFPFVQHHSLRLTIRFIGAAPLNYVRFLDHAAERILLRKVGGGYIFVHRMLLEYFADLEEEQR
jgi:DNA polymerase III delta prime subunit